MIVRVTDKCNKLEKNRMRMVPGAGLQPWGQFVRGQMERKNGIIIKMTCIHTHKKEEIVAFANGVDQCSR